MKGSAGVGFFAYDNETFIVENFAAKPDIREIRLPAGKNLERIGDKANEMPSYVAADGRSIHGLRIAPSSFAAYRVV